MPDRPTPSVQATQEPPESALPCNLTGLTDDELIGLVLNVPDGPTDVEVRQIIEHVRDTEAEEWRKIVSAQRVNAYAAGQRMGQPSTDPRLADLARWIVQEADNQIDSRGQARRDHACAECIPGGEIVIPGFRCALHIAREIDRCTEQPKFSALRSQVVLPAERQATSDALGTDQTVSRQAEHANVPLHYMCVACATPIVATGMCDRCSRAWGLGVEEGKRKADGKSVHVVTLLAMEHAVLSASTLEIAQEGVKRISSGRLLPSELRTEHLPDAITDLFYEVEQHIKKNSSLEMGGRKFKTPSIAKLADALEKARERCR